jgi:hypothetical protein
MPIIIAMWEAETRRTAVQGQPGGEPDKTSISTSKPGMVAHTIIPAMGKAK